MNRKKGILKNKTFTIQKTARQSRKAHTDVKMVKSQKHICPNYLPLLRTASLVSSGHEDVPCHPLLSHPCCLAPGKCHFGGGKGLNEHLAANICQSTPHILRSISRDQGILDEKPRAHLLLPLSFPTAASVSYIIPTSTVSRPYLISFDDPSATQVLQEQGEMVFETSEIMAKLKIKRDFLYS